MASESAALVQKLWNYCNLLRDDGVSYGDYVEQLTYLLFLKKADEHQKPPFNKPSTIPEKYGWEKSHKKTATNLKFTTATAEKNQTGLNLSVMMI